MQLIGRVLGAVTGAFWYCRLTNGYGQAFASQKIREADFGDATPLHAEAARVTEDLQSIA